MTSTTGVLCFVQGYKAIYLLLRVYTAAMSYYVMFWRLKPNAQNARAMQRGNLREINVTAGLLHVKPCLLVCA